MESRKQTISRPAEAIAIACLMACLGALGLHAATQTTNFDPAAATVGNARIVALAITQYEQDSDEMLPNMQNSTVFQTALRPYVPDPAVFISRDTGKPFIPNAALSGKSLVALGELDKVAAFRDVVPPCTLPATVGFLDDHIEQGGVYVDNTPYGSYLNAKALALGVIQYTQDWDGKYPPMKTQAEFQTALLPYTRSSRPFIDPFNGKPFIPNPALSQVTLASITNPDTTVLLQSDMPYLNGVPTIAYADGRVTPIPPGINGNTSGERDVGNLSQIGRATALYTQDNSGFLPPTNNYAAFEAALTPYLGNGSLFVSPGTGLPYILNPAISGINFWTSGNFYTEEARDAKTYPDGTLNRLNLSGQVTQDLYFVPKSLIVTPAGQTRLLWPKVNQQAALWAILPSGNVKSIDALGTNSSAIAFGVGADNQTRLLWRDNYSPSIYTAPTTGAVTLNLIGADGSLESSVQYGPYDGWTALLFTTGADDTSRLLWQRGDGALALWTLSSAGDYLGSVAVPVIHAGTPIGLTLGADGLTRLLWKKTSGDAALWTLAGNGSIVRFLRFTSPPGETLAALGLGGDGLDRLLWSDGQDHAAALTLAPNGTASSLVAFTLPGGGSAAQISAGSAGKLRVLWEAADGSGQLQTLTAKGSQSILLNLTPYQ